MSATRTQLDGSKPRARSRITNGKAIVAEIDGRSLWVRRLRDVLAAHIADLGGNYAITEAERSICKRAATLTVELERLETKFASGEASPADLDSYQRCSNTLRRLLESVGLERRSRDITPSLDDYVASKARQKAQDAEEAA